MGVNLLGAPAQVFLFEAINSDASTGFNFSPCFRGRFGRRRLPGDIKWRPRSKVNSAPKSWLGRSPPTFLVENLNGAATWNREDVVKVRILHAQCGTPNSLLELS